MTENINLDPLYCSYSRYEADLIIELLRLLVCGEKTATKKGEKNNPNRSKNI